MWIEVKDQSEIPINRSIIVEDVNQWIGQAYWKEAWFLETFNQTNNKIKFDKIVRYFIIPE